MPTLLYFHVHLVKLGNLVTEFLNGCDAKGIYNIAASPPASVVFKYDIKKVSEL